MADSAIEVRDAVIAHVRHNHPDVSRHWFDDISAVDLDQGTLWLLVAETVRRKYLQRSCLDFFTEAAQEVTGRLIAVQFVDEEQAAAISTARRKGTTSRNGSPAAHVRIAVRDDEMPISPDFTFDNFVQGPDNRLAYSAAVAVAERPGDAYNPYFIHGGVGLGKTHLIQAICQNVMSTWPEMRIYYISCDSFTNQFMEAVQAGEMMDFRNKFRNVDVLMIDDIHFLAKRNRTQEEFFHTFNALHQVGKQIVLSSDAAPNEIPDLEERLVSRFSSGLVTKIDKPCYDTRFAILKKKARLRGIDLPDPVASYIANLIDTNIRELEGAITKLQIVSSVEQKPVDLDLAREALGGQPETEVGTRPNIQLVAETVCEHYSVKLAEMLSRKKTKSIALPRQIAMWLARRLTRYSLEEVGGYFGGRDHTTVLHAIRKIEKLRNDDEQIARDLGHLENALIGHN